MRHATVSLLVLQLMVTMPGAAIADTLIVGNKAEHTVSFIDLESGSEVARRQTGTAPHEIAVSPDGRFAVVVSYRAQGYVGNSLHVFDVATARKLKVIDLGDHRAPHGLKWIPNSQRVIATTEASADVVVVDVAAGKVVGSVATGDGTHMVALSPDSSRAYAASIGGGNFSVIDLASMTKLDEISAGSGTEAIAVRPGGKEIWVGANDTRAVMIFDAAELQLSAQIKTAGVPIRVEISPDGKHAAVSQFDRGNVLIYATDSRELVATVDIASADARTPVTLLFEPNGKRLWAAATGSARVVEIDAGDWQVIRALEAGAGSDGLGYSAVTTVAD